MSIEIQVAGVGAGTNGIVVEKANWPGSDWLCPRFYFDYENPQTMDPDFDVPYRDLAVGDLVRVGSAFSGGYTDLLTVLEVRFLTAITNATSFVIAISDTVGLGLASGTASTLSGVGIGHKAIRVNKVINTLALPPTCSTNPTQTVVGGGTPVDLNTQAEGWNFLDPTLSAQWWAPTTPTNPGTGLGYKQEHFFYPLYRMIPWKTVGGDSGLTMKLSTGGKRLKAISLMGYAFSYLGDVGLHNDQNATVIGMDYLILRVREITQAVVQSNNTYADGAFAVLHSGFVIDNETGAQDYRRFSDTGKGLVDVEFASAPLLSSLTLELTDRRGKPARLGKAHFWFRAHVAA